jgi:hypothetical protein
MPLQVSSRAQASFASVWLSRSCTVTRVTGYGTNSNPVTISTDTKYKHEVLGNPQFVSSDGGVKVELPHLIKFAVGENIQPKDVIVDNESGERFQLEANISGTFKFLESFTAVSQQRKPQ